MLSCGFNFPGDVASAWLPTGVSRVTRWPRWRGVLGGTGPVPTPRLSGLSICAVQAPLWESSEPRFWPHQDATATPHKGARNAFLLVTPTDVSSYHRSNIYAKNTKKQVRAPSRHWQCWSPVGGSVGSSAGRRRPGCALRGKPGDGGHTGSRGAFLGHAGGCVIDGCSAKSKC